MVSKHQLADAPKVHRMLKKNAISGRAVLLCSDKVSQWEQSLESKQSG